jgi:putative transposase
MGGLLRQGKRVRYAFIEAEKAFASVSWMCRRFGVSSSGFYAWRKRAPSKRATKDGQLTVLIQASFDESRKTYGSPRVLEDLREGGERVGRNRVIRLMQQAGLQARPRKRFKCTTMSEHDQPVAANVLDRNFDAGAPNRRWVGDTTEMLTTSGGKFFLAAVVDLYSRFCVGWAVSAVNDRHLTMRALASAIRRRCPDTGLLHHSDRGSTYASEDYQDLLTKHGIECSMSRRGNCLDNAAMESWFSTVKFELGETFESIHRGKEQLFDYIEVFYNQRRRHSTLDYLSPARYERRRDIEPQRAA